MYSASASVFFAFVMSVWSVIVKNALLVKRNFHACVQPLVMQYHRMSACVHGEIASSAQTPAPTHPFGDLLCPTYVLYLSMHPVFTTHLMHAVHDTVYLFT